MKHDCREDACSICAEELQQKLDSMSAFVEAAKVTIKERDDLSEKLIDSNLKLERVYSSLSRVVSNFSMHRPLLPDQELPQDLAFLCHVIRGQQESLEAAPKSAQERFDRATFFCDTCGEELQREACNHIRPCRCTLTQIASLKKFIDRYGSHDKECSNAHPAPCRCGFDEARAALTEKRVRACAICGHEPHESEALLSDRCAKCYDRLVKGEERSRSKPMSLEGQTSEVFQLILAFFDGDRRKAAFWMEAANPLTGGIPPIRMIELGRGEKLLRLVKETLRENERPEEK